MSNPKVSIIIPCFNGEKYLREAIDSALAQTYENIEVIVVNDGSSDGTENIALEYGDKIRYFKKENGGVSSALNLGISKMEGEYFSWLSHDDLFLPEKTEKQVNALLGRQEEKIFVYSNFTCLIEKDGSYQRLIPANRLYGDLCEKSAFPVLFNLINGCTVLIHKSLFEKYGLFDETLSTSQDYDMWMKLLFDNEPIYLEESLVITRIHDKQGSKTISEFSDNCQRQQIDMVRRLDDKKIEYVFAGKYKLFADMIELSIKNEWDTCVDTFYSAFEKEDEPKKTGFTSNIYIYGAGTNGHKILEECHIKGVNVKAVIDRRSELWGHNILGTECKPLCDIPYESEIWIAVEDDLVIKQELIAQGFTVKDFTETNVSLFNALPTKNRIYELVNTYRKRRRGDMKFFVLGARGMAGHVVALYLKEQGHQVVGYARQPSPVCETIVGDAFDTEKIKSEIQKGGYDVVVNCIGILNNAVDRNLATGVYVNSYFPHYVAECCDSCGSKFIHLSSDCVFSGKAAGYVEEDIPDETSYYGRTKFLGEVTSGIHLSLRTSIVGPELKESGIGLFNWFMHQKDDVHGYAHVMWSGVTTIELAKAISAAAEQKISGLYYLSNNVGISKYELLKMFNHFCNKDRRNIIKSEEPINSKVLVCTRTDFDYNVPDYEDMVREMSEWILGHPSIYGQYI